MITGNEFIDLAVVFILFYAVVYYFAMEALRRADEHRRAELTKRIDAIQEQNRKRQEETWNTFLSGS